LSPAATVQRADYTAWMHSFGPETTHVLCGAAGDTEGSVEAHSAYVATTIQCNKLHLAVPALFPHLRTLYGSSSCQPSTTHPVSATGNVVQGVPGMRYTFLPLRNLGLSYPTVADAVDCMQQAQQLWQEALEGENASRIAGAQKELVAVQAAVSASRPTSYEGNVCDLYGLDSTQASLLARTAGCLSFLGTGCAVPSKYRNVSGILLDLPRDAQGQECALLIDAGEGTWSQMLRLLCETNREAPVSALKYRLARKLRVVWVSHPHADHHLGLVRVIAERWAALQHATDSETGHHGPLLVIAPASVLAFLRDYAAALNGSLSEAYIGVSCRDFDPNDDCRFADMYWNDSMLPPTEAGAEKRTQLSSTALETAHGTVDRNEDESGGDRKRQKSEPEQAAPIASATMDVVPDSSPSSAARRAALTSFPVPAEECGVTGTAGGGRAWRNYRSVFREEVSPAVRQARRAARAWADAILIGCGVTSLSNVQVVHCGQSYGLCLEFLAASGANDASAGDAEAPRSIKVVYSGDTRPCERLVEAGRGATVLIHEATFENDKAEEALTKRHSTLGEAIEVGRQIGAFRTVLTHFSQRYPGVPQLETLDPALAAASAAVAAASDAPAPDPALQPSALPPILAFDFMQLAFRDLLWAPAATPLLAVAYPAGSSNTLQQGKGTAAGGAGAEEDEV
jgi:ribonuclease BN (tRNA processing enzyme)